MITKQADVTLEDHGTVVLLQPLTGAGLEWLQTNVQTEGWQWFGSALAVEPRCAAAVVEGMVEDGLEVAA